MTTLRSAFPVRISYNVNVLSEPMLASTDDSLILKRTDVIVSVDVGKVRFDTGALLEKISCVRILSQFFLENWLTLSHPISGLCLMLWQREALCDDGLLNCRDEKWKKEHRSDKRPAGEMNGFKPT
jgi:hypothetical protein